MSSLSEDICPSDITRKTQDKVLSAVHSNSSVLLLGESGSGKDFLARQIHDRSSRSKRPFLLVNCAAIPLSVAKSGNCSAMNGVPLPVLSKKGKDLLNRLIQEPFCSTK